MSFNENKSNREAFIFKAYSLISCIVRSIFFFQYVKKKKKIILKILYLMFIYIFKLKNNKLSKLIAQYLN
jgi:hypothetical protein